jgi:hypothetical protein
MEIDDRQRAEGGVGCERGAACHGPVGHSRGFLALADADVTAQSPLWFATTGYIREQWESRSSPVGGGLSRCWQ